MSIKTNTGKRIESTNPDVIFGELEKSLQVLANQLRDGRQKQIALFKSASVIRKEIAGGIDDWNKPVSRYNNGKKVATYYPGNLKRSIQILSHMKDKKNKYVGVLRNPSSGAKGNFVGSKADGWYGHIVDQRKPYVQPGVTKGNERAKQIIMDYIKQQLSGRS